MDDLTRREFVRRAGAGAAGMQVASVLMPAGASAAVSGHAQPSRSGGAVLQVGENMIGEFGGWAASIAPDPPELSLRRGGWDDLERWRSRARDRLLARLAQPDTGAVPPARLERRVTYDGLDIEELSWQLPYGSPTRATLLKPAGARGRLPGVVALHDHGGNKYFGRRKLTRTGDDQHPRMVEHQERYYGGRAWANELARLGYVVLVPDAFAFASRRVRIEDVPERIRPDPVPDLSNEDSEAIAAYNRWASNHEHILSKSLLSAGTTWPGTFLAEDQRALDVLAARDDVDPDRLGCCGLSGGGLRSCYLGGADPRIRCAVVAGMMTTWRDYLLYKSHTHTWMVYIPVLPRELDYPEVLGLRVPDPALVLNNSEDALFTLPEMRRADEILKEVYAKAGAPDRYRASFHPGPHKFDLPMQEEAFGWFERWL